MLPDIPQSVTLPAIVRFYVMDLIQLARQEKIR